MGDAAFRSPEGEAIIESKRVLIGELNGPVRAAVHGLVNAKICRIIADGHEVGDLVAHAVYISELLAFRSWPHGRFPVLSAACGEHVGAARSSGPDHAGIHRTHRNQQLSSAAALRSNFGLMIFPIFFRKGK